MKTGPRLFIVFIFLMGLFAIQPTRPAYAAGIIVNTNADNTTTDGSCTLREAINNANNDAATYADCTSGSGADTITFDSSLSGTTIYLASTLIIATNTTLTIDGSALTSKITLSGD